ncbi:hypothetical protein [Comamonas serinivorans]|nr:hypothetical protein [Comamonas serinivorans]
MAKVIAFRRSAAFAVTLLGLSIAFKPDDDGVVSAEVTHGEALDRFAAIASDYRVVAETPAVVKAEPDPATAQPKSKAGDAKKAS